MSNIKTKEGLQRVVGIPGLSLAIVNGIIGAGIFVLPAIVNLKLGAFSIVGYIFCIIMLAAILLCYAEIGSRVTTSGGSYAYVEAAFGPFPAYVINWLSFFGWGILGSAALMNIIADSLAIFVPTLSIPLVRSSFFFVLIGCMIWVNIKGAKYGVRLVQFITIIKLIPLLAIIVFGFSSIKLPALNWGQAPSLKTFGDTALILFFAFAGFETALGVSGELKNPKRTVPISILIGGLVVLTVYLLLQLVTQGVLGTNMAAFKDAPLAAVAAKIAGPLGATALIAVTAISCFGSVSADVLATPRVLFAAANDGSFPAFLGKVHPKNATPFVAIISYAALIFMFSVFGGFKQLAVLASAAILVIYLAVILATIRLRTKKTPVIAGTFKVPGGLFVPVIGIISITWLLASLTKKETLATVVFIILVSSTYFVVKKLKKRKMVLVPGENIVQQL